MANDCMTTIHLVGDPKELEDIYKYYLKNRNDFDWLTKIVPQVADWEEQYHDCIDFIEYTSGDSYLTIGQTDRWRENVWAWYALAAKYESIKVRFYALEPGMEYYIKNDPNDLEFDINTRTDIYIAGDEGRALSCLFKNPDAMYNFGADDVWPENVDDFVKKHFNANTLEELQQMLSLISEKLGGLDSYIAIDAIRPVEAVFAIRDERVNIIRAIRKLLKDDKDSPEMPQVEELLWRKDIPELTIRQLSKSITAKDTTGIKAAILLLKLGKAS